MNFFTICLLSFNVVSLEIFAFSSCFLNILELAPTKGIVKKSRSKLSHDACVARMLGSS
jgi:hypothetical protein